MSDNKEQKVLCSNVFCWAFDCGKACRHLKINEMNKEQIKEEARQFRINENDDGAYCGFIAGAEWMQSELESESTALKLEVEKYRDSLIWIDLSDDNCDRELYPNDFDPVLCLNENGEYQVLQLMHYTSSIIDSEWETVGLKRNVSYSINYVKKYQYINYQNKQ